MESVPQMLRVFLSSPGDVADERRRARRVIEELRASHLLRNRIGIQLVDWNDPDAATPLDARESPQRSVNRFNHRPAECDLTLVILWSRIGTPLPDFTRPDNTPYESGTVWEYEDARTANRSVLIYRRTTKPRVDVDDPEYAIKQAQYRAVDAFVASLKGGGVNRYESRKEFSRLLRQHLEAFISERLSQTVSPSEDRRRARRTLPLPPDLPSEFVARPREYEVLLAHVLKRDQAIPTTIETALQGAGGYGKTTLAIALCHDARVKDAFPDGVLWTSLGQTPSILDELARWCEALTGERPAFTHVSDAAAALAAALEERRCLLVIDDVWDRTHLEPFLRGGPRCARLVTTRRVDLLHGAPRVRVDEMQATEAQQLLATVLPLAAIPRRRLGALATRLGEWPLLLRLARGLIRARLDRGDSVDGALTFVERLLDKHGVTVFDARDASRRDDSVRRTVAASREQLDRADERRFLDLAIFPEDTAIPLTTLERLWQLDDVDAAECARRLDDVSLIALDLNRGLVSFHDVMRAYLRHEVQDAAPMHTRLVAAYGDVLRLPDAYAWRWLPYHMQRAGQMAQLRALLLDADWLREQGTHVAPYAQLQAFDWVTQDAELELVRAALRLALSTLAIDPGQFCEQMLARLPMESTAEIGRFRARLQAIAPVPRLHARWPNLASPGSLVQTLLDERPVMRAWLLPDGRILSWNRDRFLRVWDLATGESRTLAGPEDVVNGALVLPDGHVLSWSADKTLRVWDVMTGESRVLRGHTGRVQGALLLPDGRVLSWSDDKTLRLWDVATGEGRAFSGHTNWVTGALLLTDGSILSWSRDGTLRVWDVATAGSRVLTGHKWFVGGALVLPDGRVLSWCIERTLRVWNVATGESRTLTVQEATVVGALLLEGAVLLWGADRTLRIWDLVTDECRALAGHEDDVNGALLLPDGSLLSWSRDCTLRVWDVSTGKARALIGHEDAVKGALLLPDGRVLSWSDDDTLRVWDVATGASRALCGHEDAVDGAWLLPDGRALSWSCDGTLRVWDVSTSEGQAFTGHQKYVYGALPLPDGRVLSWSVDCTLRVWDVATNECQTLTGHQDYVYGAMLLPDGRVLSWGADDTPRVWDLATGSSRTLCGHRGRVRGALLLPDGHVLSWSGDGTLQVWDLSTAEGRALTGHEDRVTDALLLPDGHVLSCSGDHTLRVWDLATGDVRTFTGHTAAVYGVLQLPAGRVLSWDRVGTLRVWDMATGLSRVLNGDREPVKGALLLPDGRVLSWSDLALRMWDVVTGESHAFSGHEALIDGVLLLPDEQVLSWSRDGRLLVWDLATDTSHELTGHRAAVRGACLLPDGAVLSWGEDRCVRRQPADRKSSGQAFYFDAVITSVVAISPDQFFVGDAFGRVHFLDLIAQPRHAQKTPADFTERTS
jgi:WD40 repeat protein